MGKAKCSAPLIFQSKLLCISLLYLVTTVFLTFYTSLSPNNCFFRSSPFDPIQTPFFTYPSSYGEHKYAIPTHRSSCYTPVYFSDYWLVLKDIQHLCQNSSVSSHDLRYMTGKNKNFGGNFSTQKRISYFDHLNDTVEVPCGFFKKFPISDSDKMAMESCHGVVVVSAIFNDHDKIRQPRSLGSKTLDDVCFFMFVDDITLERLDYHHVMSRNSHEYNVGVWRIVKVSSKDLYDNPAMNGVVPKYLIHRLFPNSKFSIWVDAKLQLMVDPLLLVHALVVSEKVDMAISKHPIFIHTIEEALATARWKKWKEIDGLRKQMETYCENGLQPWTPKKPYPSGCFCLFMLPLKFSSCKPILFVDGTFMKLKFKSIILSPTSKDRDQDVPDSALIVRKHGVSSNLFCCLLFNELEAFNPRDQLPFAYIRDHIRPNLKLNMFEVEVFEQVALEYRHNIKKDGTSASEVSTSKRIKRVSNELFLNSSYGSKCQEYLLKMWGGSPY